MAESEKPSPENVKEKRLTLLQNAADAAEECSKIFVKQKIILSALGISSLVALLKIGKDNETGTLATILEAPLAQATWGLGNLFFILVIFITLRELRKESEWGKEVVLYYYNYDDPEKPDAKAEKKKLAKKEKKLLFLEKISDIYFTMGIVCAIVFTWLTNF